MQGQLFTQYFLTEGIAATQEWRTHMRTQAAAFAEFRSDVRRLFEDIGQSQNPNEAQTEQDLILPILQLLDWTDHLPQQGTARGEDVPDLLLFADEDARALAVARPRDRRFARALAIVESKRFGRPLDVRGGAADAGQFAFVNLPAAGLQRPRGPTPHGQMLRYLTPPSTGLDGPRWGILTNGAVWRLYDQRARPRASGYFETDLARLAAAAAADDSQALRRFYLLFRRAAFVRRPGAAAAFLDTALAEGRRYEQRVAQDVSDVVFQRVFPQLAQALSHAQPQAALADVRQAALILLYRLLFVFFAEDRGLLPVDDDTYDEYSLRRRVRDDVARRMNDGDTFSAQAASYYDHVTTLCRIIDKGDASIRLPPYNGGLFAPAAAPLLDAARLPDAAFAPVIHDLSHTETDGRRRFVNYRDMSVQQLGSIEERLLERLPVRGAAGRITIRLDPYARKDSGSFYTPQALVDLIVDQTLKPLVDARRQAFETKAAKLKHDRRRKSDRKADLRRLDPAEAVLELKVLDPAMGSGHFLVSAVDFLVDAVMDLLEYAPTVPDWLDDDDAYESPLVERVAAIRADITQRAKDADWALDETQLTDQAIVRRLVLKRCIYGVDKNPLTVELAKVSLWLHSFTAGAPLSFLDHHLRRGDSLLGLWTADARRDVQRLRTAAGRGGALFADSDIAGIKAAADGVRRIELLADADLREVQESDALFRQAEAATADLRAMLDVLCGLRWLTAGMRVRQRAAFEAPLGEALTARRTPLVPLLARGLQPPAASGEASLSPVGRLWRDAAAAARREDFLHWEAAFPGVWSTWLDDAPPGGFDAVIGNPPWDRIKLQEVEWFATRDAAIAGAPTAAARKAAIARLRETPPPAPDLQTAPPPTDDAAPHGPASGAPQSLAADFDAAKERAERLGQMVRGSGHYPLLGSGDINLYALFVERALRLVKPDGLVGLLTPSGIYADKTAARFFRSVSTSGRLGGLFDFENKKIFFKDVHASFKFCALIVGGERRKFDDTRCAFFLRDTETIGDADRCFALSPDDFARVNPNTGAAPVFRTRRDAEITRGVYERHPVLVDRSDGGERKTWPVKYVRMLDMTNDSHLFRTAAQLDADGFYPVHGNRWRRGKVDLYLPLYQGRMIWQFDHRASSVRVNPRSVHNPYVSEDVEDAQHRDPDFLPQPQYWVPAREVESSFPRRVGYTLGFRDITNPTNERTVVASIVPWAGYGNTVPLLHNDLSSPTDVTPGSGTGVIFGAEESACLTANLNAACFDFIARHKVQGTHVNWYILEQLPVIAPEDYERRFGNTTARELVCGHVLRLTYTSHDMAPFARGLGYTGPPFVWNQDERRHLRARLDALYFHLYGLQRDDAAYVLDTFPIVRRKDESQSGRYLTRDLILAYINALSAGDTNTEVTP